MRLLLDTHILLWWVQENPSLPLQARAAIADPASQVFVSAATAWEIAIKQALGKLNFPIARMTEILHDEGFAPLAMDIRHAVIAAALPPHHHDPFDRMLVAQAQHEGVGGGENARINGDERSECGFGVVRLL